MASDFVYASCAALTTATMMWLMRRPAESIGLLDYPRGHKTHNAAVPLTGGPAMLLSFLLFVSLFQLLSSSRYQGLLTGTLLLALIGF
ncbi:MAG TPA: hypothetical protein VKB96_04790, partial [Gammaproteobacteria bacterium]|nr:hypothetical protein [Gammaproteobacteria bacterium]